VHIDRDESWFASLFETHRLLVIRFVSRRLQNDDDIRDVVSEVFTIAWAQRDSIPHPPKTYLLMIAQKMCQKLIDQKTLRGADNQVISETEDPTVEAVENQAIDASIVADAARNVLSLLSEADAEILKLAAWDGLEPGEIAIVLGIAPTAARVRLHRAKSRAEKILQKSFPELTEERIDLSRAKPVRKVFNERS